MSEFEFIDADAEHEMSQAERVNFSFNRKSFGLTYSQTDASVVNKNTLVDFFLEDARFEPYRPVVAFKFGDELHQDGGTHTHGYLKFAKAIHKQGNVAMRFFDYLEHHPNILKGAPGNGWEKYCEKYDKEARTNIEAKRNVFGEAIEMAEAGNAHEALEMLVKEQPRFMLTNYDKVESVLGKREREFAPPAEPTERAGEWIHLDWDHDIPSGTPSCLRVLVLTGGSGIGKTTWAMDGAGGRWEPHEMLLVTSIETIKTRFNARKHKCLVFDDMYFDDRSKWPIQQQIYLCDVEYDREIQCRFQPAFIPKGVQRIFCTNSYPFDNSYGIGGAVHPVGRRVVHVEAEQMYELV